MKPVLNWQTFANLGLGYKAVQSGVRKNKAEVPNYGWENESKY